MTSGSEPASNDVLAAVRAELDTVESFEVDDRIAVFERVNGELARELAALDEV